MTIKPLDERKVWKKFHSFMTYGKMTAAAFIYAMGISLFLSPNSLAPGGVTGIAVILSKFTVLQTGTWILVLNFPILFVGSRKFGRTFIISTLYCTVLSSFLSNVLDCFGPLTEDCLLAALFGGSLIAIGLGVILKNGASTGGMDIVIKLIQRQFPHLKTGALLLLLDAIVVTVAALVLQNLERALYAGVSVIVTSFVLDVVLYGREEAKLFLIISDQASVITGRFLEELQVGATLLKGSGAYSAREKKVILCIMHKNLAPRAENIVKKEDPGAFMIISNASEIYGEGYKSLLATHH